MHVQVRGFIYTWPKSRKGSEAIGKQHYIGQSPKSKIINEAKSKNQNSLNRKTSLAVTDTRVLIQYLTIRVSIILLPFFHIVHN